jgi:hypothetical protein
VGDARPTPPRAGRVLRGSGWRGPAQ